MSTKTIPWPYRKEEAVGATASAALTDELLLYIFGFFVQPPDRVDEKSLLSVLSVCKRWNRVAESPRLWKPLDFRIVNFERQRPSLVGFCNLQSLPHGFAARQRATNRLYMVVVSDQRLGEQSTPSFVTSLALRQLYWGHFFYRVSFLRRAGAAQNVSTTPLDILDMEMPSVRRTVRIFPGVDGDEYPRDYTIDMERLLFEPLEPGSVDSPTDWGCWERKLNHEISDHEHFVVHDFDDEHLYDGVFDEVRKAYGLVGSAESNEVLAIRHLLELEKGTRPGGAYGICPTKRLLCVNLLVELADMFNLPDLTLFRAMSFFDMHMRSNVPVSDARIQCAASASLFLASRVGCVGVRETQLNSSWDPPVSVADIQQEALTILQSCNYRLAFPTVLDFVLRFAKLLGIHDESVVIWRLRYFSEIALFSPPHLSRDASEVAVCVVVLALSELEDQDLWPDELGHATGLEFSELEHCMVALCSWFDFAQSTPINRSVETKYRSVRRAEVGLQAVPVVSSFSTLEVRRARFRQNATQPLPIDSEE